MTAERLEELPPEPAPEIKAKLRSKRVQLKRTWTCEEGTKVWDADGNEVTPAKPRTRPVKVVDPKTGEVVGEATHGKVLQGLLAREGVVAAVVEDARPTSGQCEDCGAPFIIAPKGAVPTACRPCRIERDRAGGRERARKKTLRRQERLAEERSKITCAECGSKIDVPLTGALRLPTRCRRCKRRHLNEKTRRWKSENPDKVKEWVKNNLDKRRAYERTNFERHTEKVRARRRAKSKR